MKTGLSNNDYRKILDVLPQFIFIGSFFEEQVTIHWINRSVVAKCGTVKTKEAILSKYADHFDKLLEQLDIINPADVVKRILQRDDCVDDNTIVNYVGDNSFILILDEPAHISNDILVPLNSIIGITSILQDTNLSLQQTDYVETLYQSGLDLIHLVKSKKSFSKESELL